MILKKKEFLEPYKIVATTFLLSYVLSLRVIKPYLITILKRFQLNAPKILVSNQIVARKFVFRRQFFSDVSRIGRIRPNNRKIVYVGCIERSPNNRSLNDGSHNKSFWKEKIDIVYFQCLRPVSGSHWSLCQIVWCLRFQTRVAPLWHLRNHILPHWIHRRWYAVVYMRRDIPSTVSVLSGKWYHTDHISCEWGGISTRESGSLSTSSNGSIMLWNF